MGDELDDLIEESTVDASNESEQLEAFRQACENHFVLPCEGFVIGEPISVIGFDYDRRPRAGLTARCRRADGSQYTVAAADVAVAHDTEGARYLAAYRKWLGLAPWPPERQLPAAEKPGASHVHRLSI